MILLIYRRLIQSCVAVGAHRGRPGRTHPCPRRVLALEALENRTVMSTLFVSPTGSYNGQPAFTTIQSAVNAAAAGDGIVVAKATYHENVTIPVAVNLRGAESGVDPNSGTRSNPANESIVSGSLTVRASNVTINGFTVQNSSGCGISVANGVGQTKILDNILQDNHVGLMLQGDIGTSVTENLIENSVGPNVDVAGGTGDSFSRNSVEDAGAGGSTAADGLDVDNGSSGIKIEHNSISFNTGEGLFLFQASTVTVSDNTLLGNNVNIGLVQASTNTIESNLVENAVTDGIEVGNSGGNKFENNAITANATGGQGQGIVLSTVTNTTISGNTVSNNMTNGIEIDNSSGVKVEHNTVTGSQGRGILLSTVTGTSVSGNTVSNNMTGGIELADASSNVSISTNTVNSNGGDGIALSDTTGSTVVGNTLSGNANGIHLNRATNNTIKSNTVRNSKNDGIWLDATSAGNMVTLNVASGSGDFDAEDDSTGGQTAGTANTWIGNLFETDNKSGGLSH